MRTSVDVRSHQEGDALKLALTHPALKTASVITGLLLELPSDFLRVTVLGLVKQQVQIATYVPADEIGIAGNSDEQLRLVDGSDTGE